MEDILKIIPYNNRYAKAYLSLAKLISDDYHVKEVDSIQIISNFLFYKEYGIKLNKLDNFESIKTDNLDIHTKNTIYRAIMYNDKEKFITFTGTDEFDKNQKLESDLYPPFSKKEYSLLELCCYHGAVDCFKLLRTKFNSEITEKCLEFSFLGGNPEIMSECLKYQKPTYKCVEYAIISRNIDFVTFLMNEYNIEIDLEICATFKNLDAFLVYFDQTNDLNKCFINSAKFAIPSLCEYFLSHGAKVNAENNYGETALHFAAKYNCKETAEVLLSHGANVNAKDIAKETALHFAARYNCKETAEVLLSHGANVNAKNEDFKETALHIAADFNCKETVEVLLKHGANINEKNNIGETVFQIAADRNYKEIAEALLSHGQNINEKDENGFTALHLAAPNNCKEIVELLLSRGANINEKSNFGRTALHFAAKNNRLETAELLLLHGANVNEKDEDGYTALHFAASYNSKETAELLFSHGAKI
ncbi:ankyrin repeat protein, putative [Trichomonas vaginalis G3]|uniref:Ankyrin repeat protein, putative n=1 Tax=Trichomonas vaginalis (strain ATCC PRA-98 / G3) TaxID=412133 RepID=A2FXR6_TRIV3|nr:ankyrin repeat and SOCS box-containing protein 4 family [Trichomonas vaginalis G3]EAX90307.1 ankyrin repeat protein, putative [Trichomonas vaginalis G3]KAI5491158.1 ankyrin repeat and SOCS box-containing protein 4 family [Trichomonas vaginalis G3]|eukprot:XP_001303237.1 ankyrin repeat protein [Trichomonas vaginalis G3]